MELEYSQAAPSLATYNNKLWTAFLGKSSNDIYTCSSSDGLNWTSHTDSPVNQSSTHTPALCKDTFDSKLWLAFSGNTSNEVFVCSYDGTKWSGNVSTKQTTKAAPAIAVFQNKLWVAFIANNSSNDILLTSSSDGKTWSDNIQVPNQSSGMAPTLSVFDNKLWLGFIANNGSNDILVYSSADAKTWTASTINQQSSAAPALSAHKNNLYIAFTGNTSSDLRICSLNGNSWSDNSAIANQTSQTGPGLVDFNGKLELAFLSADVSNRLFCISSSDAKTWTPAYQIGNYPTEIQPSVGIPNTIHYGSGVNEAQFSAKVVLNSNGKCTFSGTYVNNGTLPILTAYAQNYSVACVLLADGKSEAFTFEHSATCQNAKSDSWNINAQNSAIAANWPAIVQASCQFNSTNNSPPGGVLNAIEGAFESLLGDVEDVIQYAGTVISVVGEVAAVVASAISTPTIAGTTPTLSGVGAASGGAAAKIVTEDNQPISLAS